MSWGTHVIIIVGCFNLDDRLYKQAFCGPVEIICVGVGTFGLYPFYPTAIDQTERVAGATVYYRIKDDK